MNAGSGIVHEEMPVPEHLETGGPIEGVQLWINLPRAAKGSAPGYTDLQPETLPWQPIPGGRIRVLAGTLAGFTGPALTPASIAYAHVELEAGADFQQDLPEGWTAAVVPLQGTVRIEGTPVPADTVALLGAGSTLAVAAEGGTSFMVLAGAPLGEPIAHYGPFVMSSRDEIEQALLDCQEGRMGHLE
jgi:hypothetical protein